MRGRLNLFQRTMLRWDRLHPYNAVHAVRLPGPPDLNCLAGVIDRVLESRGLVGLELNTETGSYCYRGGPARCELKTVSGTDDPHALLQAETERQLNTAFAVGDRLNPFRFFVVLERGCSWLGLAYFHAVADAHSILGLLQEIFRVHTGRADPTSAVNDLYPRGQDRLLLRRPAVLAQRLAALPDYLRNMRRSSRPHYQNPSDFNNGLIFFSLLPADLRSLLQAGKAWEVTFHDLILALLMKSLSVLVPANRRTGRRDRLSVGTIVNLRRDLGPDYGRVFGLFLGSFVVTHPVPEGVSVRDLAREIRQTTRRVKQRRLYLGTPLELAAARLALSFFSTEQRKKFYQKHFPLWGGVTNMNLNPLWEPRPGEAVPEYFRAVSTGPVTPLVLSVTTAGDVANIGLSYRSTVFSAEAMEQFRNGFLNMLRDGVGRP